ncbi:MAG: ankyrin repeat domain-containing protein [Nannocystales bacterium]
MVKGLVNKDIERVRASLADGADPNHEYAKPTFPMFRPDVDGKPLEIVCHGGNGEFRRKGFQDSATGALLEAGASFDTGSGSDCGPLSCFLRKHDLGAVELLLEAGADPRPEKKCSGEAPLLTVFEDSDLRGKGELTQLLIERGADPSPALHSAALAYLQEHVELDTVTLLLDAGADPNFESSKSYTRKHGGSRSKERGLLPLDVTFKDLVSQERKLAVVTLLLERGASTEPYHGTAWGEFASIHTPELTVLLEEEFQMYEYVQDDEPPSQLDLLLGEAVRRTVRDLETGSPEAQGGAACVKNVHAGKTIDRKLSDSWDGTDTSCVVFACGDSNIDKTLCQKPDGTWRGGKDLTSALREACDCD